MGKTEQLKGQRRPATSLPPQNLCTAEAGMRSEKCLVQIALLWAVSAYAAFSGSWCPVKFWMSARMKIPRPAQATHPSARPPFQWVLFLWLFPFISMAVSVICVHFLLSFCWALLRKVWPIFLAVPHHTYYRHGQDPPPEFSFLGLTTPAPSVAPHKPCAAVP